MQIGMLFPIPANELAYDFHLTHETGPEGRLAVVAAMRSADLQSLLDQARAAGLRIQQVLPVALGSPLVAKAMDQANAAVVHRTAEGLAVDLVVNGELRYSRVAAMPATAIGIEGEVSRTFAAAVQSCSPTVAAGALALPEAEYSTDTWALETLAGAHIDVNIETAEHILLRATREANKRLTIAVALFIFALLPAGFRFFAWNDAQQKANRSTSFYNFQTAKAKRERDMQISKASAATNLQQVLDRGFHPAQTMSDVIRLASNDAPDGVWLTGFSLERGKPLTVRGTATKGDLVVIYQNALVAEPRLRDVKLLFATNTEIEKTPVVQFSISAFPVGNLPLIDPNAKKGAGK
jgi:hypothetical protein